MRILRVALLLVSLASVAVPCRAADQAKPLLVEVTVTRACAPGAVCEYGSLGPYYFCKATNAVVPRMPQPDVELRSTAVILANGARVDYRLGWVNVGKTTILPGTHLYAYYDCS